MKKSCLRRCHSPIAHRFATCTDRYDFDRNLAVAAEWWLRPVMSAARVGEHSAVV